MVVFNHIQMSTCRLNLLGCLLNGLVYDSLFLYLGFLSSLVVASAWYCQCCSSLHSLLVSGSLAHALQKSRVGKVELTGWVGAEAGKLLLRAG